MLQFVLMKTVIRLVLILVLLRLLPVPVRAQDGEMIPPPHLGYGIHLDPNLSPNPALVDRLGMDWVKLYDESQIPPFQHKRILFRINTHWTSDLNGLRNDITNRVRNLANLGVDAIEVHNEPNLSSEWHPSPNARQYVEVLRIAYEAIKSVSPNIIVVSGGLAPTDTMPAYGSVSDLDYARQMLEAGAARYFDAFGYHPYGYNAAPEAEPDPARLNFRRTELIRELMMEFGAESKQIWMTEFGWLRDPSEDGVHCSDSDPDFAVFAWLRVDGRTQADYIVRAFAYADQYWEWAGPMFLWNLNFSMRPADGGLSMCNHQRWFGLLRQDGSPTLALDRVAAMPKRYSQYLPQMTLYADEMTLVTSTACPGIHQVGSFVVANTGYPGSFIAQIEPAQAPFDYPIIELSEASARSGDTVDVFVDVTNIDPDSYMIWINVRTTIGGELVAQNVRGFVIIQETLPADC